MKFLGHFLASLLALALSTTVFGFIVGSHLGNPKFIEQAADHADLYNQLSTLIPQAMSSGSDDPAGTKASLEAVLTPTYLRQQINMVLPQLVDHYAHGGPAPQLDLSGLADRLQVAGYPVTPEAAANLAQPKTISAGTADARLVNAGQQAQSLAWIPPVAAVLLIGLIVGVMREHRWPTLSRAAAWTAVTLALSALLLVLLPSLVSVVLGGGELKALEPSVGALLRAVFGPIARDLLLAAGVFVIIAVGLGLIHGFEHLKAKFGHHAKTPPPDVTARRRQPPPQS